MRVGIMAGLALTLAACSARTPTGATVQATKVPQSANAFTEFETLQVRPLALSPSGRLLFAANTPDNRLEIFGVGGDGNLQSRSSVVVGLEPVAIAARSESEVWVVNHLSDSISIVNVSADGTGAHVVRTLLVGDEPRDIVFAGANKGRAFITTAHRGQNDPDANGDIVEDPAHPTSMGGRADVWVFDANNLGSSLGGDRLAKLTLFADTPRALAVSSDGSTVYAAAFYSGNMTTTVSPDAVRHVYASRLASFSQNLINWPGIPAGIYQPVTGLVVKFRPDPNDNNKPHWLDFYGANFDAYTNLTLLDLDVFAIQANADAATMQATAVPYTGVGTTLFNMAVNPATGKLYVSNTDAHNDQRFEGPIGGVTGRSVDSRVSVVDPKTHAIVHNNLNNHLPGGDPSLSRAFPMDLTFSADGSKLFVVAQGSAKLAVYDSAALESGNAYPTAGNQVLLSAGGPAGVALDGNGHAYVLTRFDDGISTVDLGSLAESHHVTMYNPEPANVTAGRRFLFDATYTSKNGDQACASCHVGGDFDALAWDLGNPVASPLPIDPVTRMNQANIAVIFTIPPVALYPILGQPAVDAIFAANQPLKGPMTTQSLRGLDNHGANHWRGDRNGAIQQNGQPFLDASGNPVVSAQPDSGIFNEVNGFKSFNVAFAGLVGRSGPLSDDEMTAFANFVEDVTYPPNPIRNLDDSLTADQEAGREFYFNHFGAQELPSDRFHNCNGCHTLDPNGNAQYGVKHPGFFGSDGRLSFEDETQIFKVPHLRNMYQKVGRYSSSPDSLQPGTLFPGLPLPDGSVGVLNPSLTSVRGFGFNHDGVLGNLEHFFTGLVFIQMPTNATTLFGIAAPPNPYGVPLVLYGPDGNQVYTQVPTPNGPQTVPVGDPSGFVLRKQVVSFVMAFDSNLKPIVGQQATLTAANAGRGDVTGRLALLEAQASVKNCDLVVKGLINMVPTGFTYDASTNTFVSNSPALGSLTDAQLRALVGTHTDALTFTAVPPGSGWRIGVDRNGDGNTDTL